MFVTATKKGDHMGYLEILSNYKDILLPEDIQEILHIGRNTVYRYLAEGRIRSFMIGGKYRIPKLYLLEFIYPDINFASENFALAEVQ